MKKQLFSNTVYIWIKGEASWKFVLPSLYKLTLSLDNLIKSFQEMKIIWILQGTDPPAETTSTAPAGDDSTTTDAGVVQFASGLLMIFTIFVL